MKELESVTAADFQEALPYLLVALANPLQVLIECYILLSKELFFVMRAFGREEVRPETS